MLKGNSMLHEHGKPCPITGKPIPKIRGREVIYTMYKRKGVLNACGSCGKKFDPAKELARLNEKRKRVEREG